MKNTGVEVHLSIVLMVYVKVTLDTWIDQVWKAFTLFAFHNFSGNLRNVLDGPMHVDESTLLLYQQRRIPTYVVSILRVVEAPRKNILTEFRQQLPNMSLTNLSGAKKDR